MEVAPTAHYSMGGVVDSDTHATDVAGLYAAGEVTAGLHGANQLGGNSPAETEVQPIVAERLRATLREPTSSTQRAQRVTKHSEDDRS